MDPDRLQALLEGLGLSGEAVARRFGHPPQAGRDWLAGRAPLPPEVASWLAARPPAPRSPASGPAAQAARAAQVARRSSALRANLQRRKQQARARQGEEPDG